MLRRAFGFFLGRKCGLVIPRQYWEAEIDGIPRIFCKPDCERRVFD